MSLELLRDKVREYMRINGYTFRDMEVETRGLINHTTIRLFVLGRGKPNKSTISILCDLLGENMDDYIG